MATQMKLVASARAKGLIFDLDGTLIDSMPLHWRAWRDVCKELGADIEYEFFISHTGKSVEEIARILVEHYNMSCDPQQVVDGKKKMVNEHIKEVKEIKPVADVMRMNYQKLPMTVGTGSDRRRAMVMLDNAGFTKYFAGVVSADEVTRCKPDPETFLKCAEIMGVAPEECEVFEDGEPGLQAARAAGMIATDVRPYYEIL